MHRAVYKLWANVTLGRDRFVLSPEENFFAAQAFGLQCVASVPTERLSRKLGVRGEWNVIHLTRHNVFIWPIDRNSTITFLREIIAENLKPEQTQLFESVRRGGAHTRHLSGQRSDKSDLTEVTFLAYYRKCLEHAEHISKNGFRTFGAESERGRRRDAEIGVAITPDGELTFYSFGRHRIGIARALGISHVPVQPRLVSGAYLQRFLRKSDVVIPPRIVSAVKQCWETALAHAGGMDTGEAPADTEILSRRYLARRAT